MPPPVKMQYKEEEGRWRLLKKIHRILCESAVENIPQTFSWLVEMYVDSTLIHSVSFSMKETECTPSVFGIGPIMLVLLQRIWRLSSQLKKLRVKKIILIANILWGLFPYEKIQQSKIKTEKKRKWCPLVVTSYYSGEKERMIYSSFLIFHYTCTVSYMVSRAYAKSFLIFFSFVPFPEYSLILR